MIENGNVTLKVLPLSEVYGSRKIVGNYATDPEHYSESYSLLGKGVYTFVGLVVNGIMYMNPVAQYDAKTGVMTIYKNEVLADDGACVLFNKVFEEDFLVNVKSLILTNPESIKECHGNYATDPDNYYETINMAGQSAYEFVGVSINNMFYCHPSVVSFDNVTKLLTIRTFQLLDTDNIALIFNGR